VEILIDNEPVGKEFQRWSEYFGDADPYVSDDTIGMKDVLRAHFLVADYFYTEGYGIAALGPRDPHLLHSAVYRQFVSYGGLDKWTNPFQRCATVVFGLVKGHPFHDANKRTGLLVLLYFLSRMNRVPTAKQKELEDLVVNIADNSLRKYRRQQEMQRRTDDPEIYFIADYLRRKSRKRDNRYYAITYRELDNILNAHGFCLTNPHKNFIDVCRIEKRKGFLGLGRTRTELVKLAQIGFPSWKKQVGKGAISTVRKETGLTPENGVDSESFFRGADPLYTLICEYHGPLQRLAYR
jgi:death-on-curing family protein